MYIPPHRCNNSEECEGETHRWLSSPITPEEHELLFRSQQQKKEEEDTHKYYYWNDIPTLQTKMLEYLPRHYKDCEIFTPSQQQQQQQTLMDHVSYMEFRQPKTRLCKAYRVTLAYVQEKQWSHSPVHVQFFQGLLDCPPMQLGFHTLAVPGWCFCPLSLPAWCHKHRLGHLLEKARANYCHCERRSPNAFMDHVRDMQKPSQPVLLLRELHNLLQVFLEAYYDRYGDAHHSHHAMYPLQSDKYNHVMGRKFARLQRLLELGFEQRQRWQQETLAQQKKLQELQQVKQILKNVLHQEEVEWWEKQQSLFQHARGVLGIQTTAQERQPYGRIPYQACRQTYLSRVEEILVDHCLQTTGTQVRKVTLGGSSFRAMKRLWKKRDHPYLFEDSISDLEESFFVGMDASPHSGTFVVCCLLCDGL